MEAQRARRHSRVPGTAPGLPFRDTAVRDSGGKRLESGAALRLGYAWLATFLLLPAAGAPLLAHPAFGFLSRSSRAALSGAVGAVLVSGAMTVAALAAIPWSVPGLAAAAAIVAALLRLVLHTSTETAPTGARARSALPLLCALCSAAAVAIAFDAAGTGSATSVDLVLIWGPKAQAFAAARTIDPAFLAAPPLEYMNRSYPPLVSNLYAFATMAAGKLPWGAATLLFPALLGLLALALPALLRRAAARDSASAASTLSVCALAYLAIRFEIGGNADMPLWLFEALAAAALAGPFGRDRGMPLLAGLLLAGAATSKVEGLPFVVAALGLFLFLRRHRLRAADTLLLLAPSAISLGSWFLFGASRHLFLGYRGFGPIFDLHLERLPEVLAAIAAVVGSAAGGLPFLLPLVFFLVSGPRRREAIVSAGAAAALILFFVFTYLHGALAPKEWILWTAGRIFAPVTFLLAIAGAGGKTPPADAPPLFAR